MDRQAGVCTFKIGYGVVQFQYVASMIVLQEALSGVLTVSVNYKLLLCASCFFTQSRILVLSGTRVLTEDFFFSNYRAPFCAALELQAVFGLPFFL